MKSIRTRLLLYFVFIVVITVIILEALLVNIVKRNYYKNLEVNLLSQVKISSDIYLRYFSDSSIYENVLNNIDTFWKQSPAQVEILDTKGKVLMDSIGIIPTDNSKMEDVKAALKGLSGKWTGKVDYDSYAAMAVSYPLKSGDSIVGVLRFITSLRNVDREIADITKVFIIIGIIVILISGVLSTILANSIVWPMKETTKAAEKMAAGNFKVQVNKRFDDEIGKLADTLNFMAEEILKKEELKNDFISSVSHELRTPLTSIKGWAITLKSGSLEDKALILDGLEIIEKESDRLTSMVEELLDFSKFVSGKVTVKKEKVDIAQIMGYIKKQLTPRAERDNIDFNVTCDDEIPHIFSDENRLKQVFINILDNAFRFTQPGGKVTFNAKTDRNQLVFDITDNGCGISQEELPMIKEKFFKGKGSNSRNGIGLSICDELIKIMHGSFEIKSEINKGTRVIIILPITEGV